MKLRFIGMALLSAALLLFNQAYANEKTSSEEKRLVFNECQSSCAKEANKDPATKKNFGDVPFVMESFCACYCTRVAMRMSKGSLLKASRIAAEGGKIESNKPLSDEMDRHSKMCLNAVFD